jgi:hypothetical protein
LAPPELPGRAALAPWGEEAAQASVAPARRALAALERRGALPQAWAVQARQLGEEEAAPAWGTPASAQVPEAWAAPAPWGAAAARASAAPAWQGAGTPPWAPPPPGSSSRAAPLMPLHESSSAMRRTREIIMVLLAAMDDTCCSVVCLCASCDRVESQ